MERSRRMTKPNANENSKLNLSSNIKSFWNKNAKQNVEIQENSLNYEEKMFIPNNKTHNSNFTPFENTFPQGISNNFNFNPNLPMMLPNNAVFDPYANPYTIGNYASFPQTDNFNNSHFINQFLQMPPQISKIPIRTLHDDEYIYVNAKQYLRIISRRNKRMKLYLKTKNSKNNDKKVIY
jgi:hypothetical protein